MHIDRELGNRHLIAGSGGELDVPGSQSPRRRESGHRDGYAVGRLAAQLNGDQGRSGRRYGHLRCWAKLE